MKVTICLIVLVVVQSCFFEVRSQAETDGMGVGEGGGGGGGGGEEGRGGERRGGEGRGGGGGGEIIEEGSQQLLPLPPPPPPPPSSPPPPTSPGSGGGRYRGLFRDLQRRLKQRLTLADDGDRTQTPAGLPSPIPTPADVADWNRTVAGVQVWERGIARRHRDNGTSVVTVLSFDRRLREVDFTGAATLYVFSENATMRIVKPRSTFPRAGSRECYILPDSNITFAEAMEQLTARNNTEIGAPAKVERLRAAERPLDGEERALMYRHLPPLYFFCGLTTTLVPVAPAAQDTTFPTNPETEKEQVLRIISLDSELQLLVPGRLVGGGGGRPQPREDPAPWQRPFRFPRPLLA